MIVLVKNKAPPQIVDMTLGQGKSQTEALGEVVDFGKGNKHLVEIIIRDTPTGIGKDETHHSISG